MMDKATLGLSKPLKNICLNLHKRNKERGFNLFLLGLSEFHKKNKLPDNEYIKFITLLKDKQFDSHIETIVDSLFFSQSDRCRLILGFITGKYIYNRYIDYQDIVLSASLRNLIDSDLKLFCKLYVLKPTKTNLDDNVVFCDEYTEIESVIFSKLKSLQLFGEDSKTRLSDSSKDPLKYIKTIISERLFNYVKDCEAINCV